MLVYDEIISALSTGEIVVEDEYGFGVSLTRVGPNSLDVTLGHRIGWYTGRVLDPRKRPHICWHDLREDGELILLPGDVYIASTAEYCENNAPDLIPSIDGRSSVGRLGLSIHQTAGFGDIGFRGNWTLEITVTRPVRVYAGMPIGQLSWQRAARPSTRLYQGKYQDKRNPVPSLLFEECGKEDREGEVE